MTDFPMYIRRLIGRSFAFASLIHRIQYTVKQQDVVQAYDSAVSSRRAKSDPKVVVVIVVLELQTSPNE